MNFFKKKRQRLVIEAGVNWLKWVVVSGYGHLAEILGIGAISLADRPQASAKLSVIAKKFKIAPGEASSCLPRSQVTARNLELPSTDSSEIKKIVDLQAVKQTPYTSEEIVFDYYLLNAFREGYSSVMLVIAHRDVLNAHLKVIQDAELKSPVITLGTECSSVWISGRLQNFSPKDTMAVLDVDAENIDFYIYRGGSILFTQNLLFGAEKIEADPETAVNKLIDEMARAFQIYRSEEISEEPSRIALSGAYAALLPMKEKMAQATGSIIEEVALPEEIQNLLRGAEGGEKGAAGVSYSAVLGLALRPKEPPINLIPHEMVIQESLVQKSRSLLVTGILALSIFLAIVASFAARYYEKLNYLKLLEEKSHATSEPAELVAKKRQRINEILKVHDAGIQFFDEFLHLVRAIPNDIHMTEINLTKERHFLLQGRSSSMTSVFNFVNELKANKAFKHVESKRLTKRMVDNKEVVDFEIDSVVSYNTQK